MCLDWTVFLTKFSPVTQLCLTLCDPMNCSTPGLPVHHQLPESTQTRVHRVGDAIQPSHPLSSPSPPALWLNMVGKNTYLEPHFSAAALSRFGRMMLCCGGCPFPPYPPRCSRDLVQQYLGGQNQALSEKESFRASILTVYSVGSEKMAVWWRLKWYLVGNKQVSQTQRLISVLCLQVVWFGISYFLWASGFSPIKW